MNGIWVISPKKKKIYVQFESSGLYALTISGDWDSIEAVFSVYRWLGSLQAKSLDFEVVCCISWKFFESHLLNPSKEFLLKKNPSKELLLKKIQIKKFSSFNTFSQSVNLDLLIFDLSTFPPWTVWSDKKIKYHHSFPPRL